VYEIEKQMLQNFRVFASFLF